MAAGAPVGILRLAKVVSPGMALFRDWKQQLASGHTIRAFSDMMIAPTPVELVATAIATLLRERRAGIAQLTGPRDVSYAEIGQRLAARLGARRDLVVPVSAASAGMPEGATPRHTTLDSSLMQVMLGIDLPDTWEVIDQVS
jgi:dTDP-4-dehydrorhamnose reductase